MEQVCLVQAVHSTVNDDQSSDTVRSLSQSRLIKERIAKIAAGKSDETPDSGGHEVEGTSHGEAVLNVEFVQLGRHDGRKFMS